MKIRCVLVLVGAFLGTVGTTHAQASKQKYLGKSSCDQDIQSKRPDFSMGLDKTQKTYLIHRYMSDAAVVLLIQLQGESDKCGLIRDVVEIRSPSEEFEFSCVDPGSPGDVVIGIQRKNTRQPSNAIEAWRIDLRRNAFERTAHKVRCVDENPLDSEDRGDLAEQARRRTAQQEFQQNDHLVQPQYRPPR